MDRSNSAEDSGLIERVGLYRSVELSLGAMVVVGSGTKMPGPGFGINSSLVGPGM